MGFDDTNDEGVLGVGVLLDCFVLASIDTVSGFKKLFGEFGYRILFAIIDLSNSIKNDNTFQL